MFVQLLVVLSQCITLTIADIVVECALLADRPRLQLPQVTAVEVGSVCVIGCIEIWSFDKQRRAIAWVLQAHSTGPSSRI